MIDDTSKLPKSLLRRIRWIILVLLGISVAVLLGFKTKKTIAGTITLTNTQKPVYCYSTQAGLFIPLVKDESTVEKGAYLGYLDGDYKLEDYFAFAEMLEQHRTTTPSKDELNMVLSKRLGPLNAPLLQLDQAWNKLNYHQNEQKQKLNQASANFQQKFSALQDQLSVSEVGDSLNLVLNTINEKIEERVRYLTNEDLLAAKVYEETQSGFLQNYISNVQLDFKKREIILSLLQEEGKWLDAQKEYTDQLQDLQQTVASIWLQIKTDANQFEKENILKASVNGTCHFVDFVINSNVNYSFYISKDQAFAKIEPAGDSNIIGLLDIGSSNLAKVQEGGAVRIKLDAYPFLEFGVLFGNIKSVSNIPFDEKHHVIVSFPDTLVSSYNQPIDFYPEMKGYAEIVLEESNLLLKIIQALRWYQQI